MNESERIFSEAVKNISESMKVLSKSMKASVLMLKKCLKCVHAISKTKVSTIDANV